MIEVAAAAVEARVLGVLMRGDLNGVLKGERNGFCSVFAASSRRRLAAGVDILEV